MEADFTPWFQMYTQATGNDSCQTLKLVAVTLTSPNHKRGKVVGRGNCHKISEYINKFRIQQTFNWKYPASKSTLCHKHIYTALSQNWQIAQKIHLSANLLLIIVYLSCRCLKSIYHLCNIYLFSIILNQSCNYHVPDNQSQISHPSIIICLAFTNYLHTIIHLSIFCLSAINLSSIISHLCSYHLFTTYFLSNTYPSILIGYYYLSICL